MKRCLLIALALFIFCKPVWAEIILPDRMTVKQFYDMETDTYKTSEEMYNQFFALGYLTGIRDSIQFEFGILKYSGKEIKDSDIEITDDCIRRPLNVWKSLVFDKYKLNKIKGDNLLWAAFRVTIEEVCNVDLMGLKENKITKPIPMPSSSYKVSEVTDGDTVKIIKNDEEIKVRLVDIDCFETSANPRGKWQAEHYNKSIDEVIKLGNQSKEILQDFVNQQADGKVVLVDRGKDKYKRTLGVLYIDGVNVNDYMLQYGKCEKYMPRKPLQSLM